MLTCLSNEYQLRILAILLTKAFPGNGAKKCLLVFLTVINKSASARIYCHSILLVCIPDVVFIFSQGR
jgi:hypothetical protein